MAQQLINLRIQSEKFDYTYQLNIYKQTGHKINIIVENIGTIDLKVKFFKLSNGLIECRVFQEFELGKQTLIYKQPIVSFLNTDYKHEYIHIQWKEGQVESRGLESQLCVLLCDEDGKSIGETFEVENAELLSVVITVEYQNQQKQIEADNLFKIEQQEYITEEFSI